LSIDPLVVNSLATVCFALGESRSLPDHLGLFPIDRPMPEGRSVGVLIGIT
jgi:hypothetical protein